MNVNIYVYEKHISCMINAIDSNLPDSVEIQTFCLALPFVNRTMD